MLGAAGSWRASAALAERLLSYSHPVDTLLRLRWLHVVALLKLREYARADREMSLLGDLRGAGYTYERYPGVYPGKTGSMVPFSLLLLQATLPSYSGNHEQALAQLYALLATVEEASMREQRSVILAIVNVYCALHDYLNAIAHLERLIASIPANVNDASEDAMAVDGDGASEGARLAELLSLLGRLQLQQGNLAAAEDACAVPPATARSPAAGSMLPTKCSLTKGSLTKCSLPRVAPTRPERTML